MSRHTVEKSWWQTNGPILALILLSPVLAELHFGAIRMTTVFAIIPATGAWGCGALLIRDVARRRNRHWLSIWLLGLAFAIAEECVIQQTSFAPLIGVDLNHPYGRALGVNWTYLIWAIGYESLWAVMIPILLTEQLFPGRRDDIWLGTTGLIVSVLVFLLSSIVAWYTWTQLMVPNLFPEYAYTVPTTHFALASIAITLICVIALSVIPQSHTHVVSVEPRHRPWTIGISSFVIAILWFGLVFLSYGVAPSVPPWIPVTLGLAIAGLVYAAVRHFHRKGDWTDGNLLAASLGLLAASGAAGYMVLYGSGALVIDFIGKAVVNLLVTVALLVAMRRRLKHASPQMLSH